MMKPVSLVTGAKGFIGKRLLQILRDSGREAIGWTRSDVDLRDTDAVHNLLAQLKPAYIYHLAASNPTTDASNWTFSAGEVNMLENLARAMPAYCRLIYTGTMSEYGYSGIHRECDARLPRSHYGFVKATATDRAISLAASGRHQIRVARLFSVYGPGEAAHRLVPYLVSQLTRNQKANLRSRSQVRDFIHVDDVAAILIAIAESDIFNEYIVNVGTGLGVSIQFICNAVVRWLDADPSLVNYDALPPRLIDDAVLIANIEKLNKFGLVPAQHWLKDSGAAYDYVHSLIQNLLNK